MQSYEFIAKISRSPVIFLFDVPGSARIPRPALTFCRNGSPSVRSIEVAARQGWPDRPRIGLGYRRAAWTIGRGKNSPKSGEK